MGARTSTPTSDRTITSSLQAIALHHSRQQIGDRTSHRKGDSTLPYYNDGCTVVRDRQGASTRERCEKRSIADRYHDIFKNALLKDGWTITH